MARPDSNAVFRTILSASLPADQKLRGQNNWITWYSSILISLRLFDIEKYFIIENKYNEINEDQKTASLLIIRQNLNEKPLSLILTEKDLKNIFNILKATYKGTSPILQQ